MDNFSKKLQECRKEQGLKQEWVAQQMSVTRESISKWENGSATPSLEKMYSLCKILKCSPNYLLSWEENDSITNYFKNLSPVQHFIIEEFLENIYSEILKNLKM